MTGVQTCALPICFPVTIQVGNTTVDIEGSVGAYGSFSSDVDAVVDWFGPIDMKQMAFQAMGKPLLESGFAVISISHRSSGDAKFPAQINDVKAAIRFIRANAEKYKIDAYCVYL